MVAPKPRIAAPQRLTAQQRREMGDQLGFRVGRDTSGGIEREKGGKGPSD